MKWFKPVTSLVAAGILAVAISNSLAATDGTQSAAAVTIGAQFIDIQAQTEFQSAALRITGPDGYALSRQVTAEEGSYITADLLLDAEPQRFGGAAELQQRDYLPNGVYRYEVEFRAEDGAIKFSKGAFQVQDGIAYELQSETEEVKYDGSISGVQRPGMIGRVAGSVIDFVFPSAHALTNVDNILQIQDTADSGQSRIAFESGDGTTPPSNWWLFNQDGSMFFREFPSPGSGGVDHVSILAGGNVGIGTTTPQDQLHVNDGNGFQIRLTDGSMQTRLDTFAGRFAIYQANPSQFSINNNAPTNSLAINANGDAGFGAGNPSAALHVSRSNNSANVRVEDTGSGSPQVMFQLLNNGFPQFNMQDTSQTNVNWSFRLSGTAGSTERFTITKVGTGQAEFELFANGDATFRGDVTANGVLLTSTREAKTDFRALDERDVLDRLASLEISQWRYKHEDEDTVHFGPVAEEFREVFGLSDGKRLNMIDTNGIAFAAIKALNTENETLKADNRAIRAENQAIKDRLAALEQRLAE
ncbi:MAG: hypothetical protein GVY32_01055 [Gammaproteobacteria bacterium]|nr:hypothetical protein [Gammaproteobacteria bacterium]